MQNPPPPPSPPPSGPPPMEPPGQPPMMPPGGGGMYPPAGGGAMAMPGNLASPGLRIVGGLIDVVILLVVFGIVDAIFRGAGNHSAAGLINLILVLAYFGYFWSSRGQTVGMMVFGFKVRDQQTGQFPSVGKAVLRGFIWWLEVAFTVCIIGLVGWLWMLWDPQRQAIHDKVAGTIVTTN